MPWNTPVSPVSGTVITVAWATANVVQPTNWLCLMTGNADPPGTNYVVLSSSPSGSAWGKIPSDAILDGAITTAKIVDLNVTAGKLAPNAAQLNLGYRPVSTNGDTMVGQLAISQNAGTGNNFTALNLANSAGGNSGVFVRFASGPSTSSAVGLIVGLSHFVVLDPNGIVSLYQDNLGHLRLSNGAVTVWDSSNLDPSSVTVGDSSNLNGQPGSYYRARANHTGTQLAATISDLAAAVGTMAAASATTAGTATTANSVAPLSVTDAGIAAANKDGAAATVGMRTLGGGAQQAAAGNHTHPAMGLSASGSYTGLGTTTGNHISCGFRARQVVIQSHINNVMYSCVSTAGAIAIPTGAAPNASTGVILHASDGFVVGNGNFDGNTVSVVFDWVAYG